ncbi:MAG: glycoside hydrolase family 27 protein [Puniceicoccaceae bacterium]
MSATHPHFAPTPPAGWNSFDCFGSSVTEAEVLENAQILASDYMGAGFDTVVVDYCWSHPSPGACVNPDQGSGYAPLLAMDLENRLIPAVERFPSARGGLGFGPLAEQIHQMGLKFGIHVMRGIPRQAVVFGLPGEVSRLCPREISNQESTCSWLNHMYGIRSDHPGGQTYYDSLFRLYAEWGVDYVKVDDMTFPYHEAEIEMIDLARQRCGRPMTLSLSPGACPFEAAEHVANHAELWRLSPDFWDRWADLKRAFSLCHLWQDHRRVGCWPDPDMLPIGRISKRGPAGAERGSFFTETERRTMIAFWTLFRAPMFIGGNLREMGEGDRELLLHGGLQEIRKMGEGAVCREDREGDSCVWVSPSRERGIVYAGIFNLGETRMERSYTMGELGMPENRATVRNIWEIEKEKPSEKLAEVKVAIEPHGCALFALGG